MSTVKRTRDEARALFNKQKRQQARLNVIVRTAMRLIYARGVSGLSLDDLAEELAISKTSLYYYIKAKEDLIYLCHQSVIVRMSEALEAAEKVEGPSVEKLRRFLTALVEIVLDPESGMPSLWQDAESIVTGERKVAMDRQVEAHSKRVRRLLAQGSKDGSLKPGNPEMLETLIFGSIYWIPTSRRFTPSDLEPLTKQYIDLVLDGLRSS